MQYLHIVVWICLIGWEWVFPSADQIRTAEEYIRTLGYDSESEFSDEDLDYIQRLLVEPISNESAIELIEQISILSEADITMIKKSKYISALKNKSNLNPALKLLVDNIHLLNRQNIKSSVQERISFANGTRHDWRGTVTFDNYETGLLVEKDPAEINIADHMVIYLKGGSKSFRWIVGDHQLVGGYGLVSWRTASAYKGFETIDILPRSGKGLSHFRSSNEYWSTKGVGAELETLFGNVTVSIGRNILDGKLIDNKIRVNESGRHVTKGDLKNKNQLLENSITFMWKRKIHNINTGSIINNQRVQNKSGIFVRTTSISLFSSGGLNNWQWFGEGALMNNKTSGFLGGIRYHAKKIKYLISYRSYLNGFQPYRSRLFGEWQGQTAGERGLFQNIEIKYFHHIITAYSDIAEKIEENNQTAFNQLSHETGIRWRWQNQHHLFRIQFKQDVKSEAATVFFDENTTTNTIRVTSKWKYQYTISKNVSAQWQLQTSKKIESNYRGIGIETRIHWKKNRSSFKLSWIIADVKSYNERLYFWDINLPGEMNNVVISGKGHQVGIQVQYLGTPNYRLFMRWRAGWREWNLKTAPVITGAFAVQINL